VRPRHPPVAVLVGLGAIAAAIVGVAALGGDRSVAARPPTPSCEELFPIDVGGAHLDLPYCANRSLAARDQGVRRLVVVIHGDGRNASDYFDSMMAAASAAGSGDTLIVAPQFLTADDQAAIASEADLYYSDNGWKEGDASATAPLARPASVSSFAALDDLVRSIVAGGAFPNLHAVVITGHSAGGQFVDRYVATSPLEDELGGAISFRYVIANPSSYLYFDTRRPGKSGDGLGELSRRERDRCPAYDTWKYGTDGLNRYAAQAGSAAILTRYGQRTIAYLLGGDDTDPHDSSLDGSCAAEWQGQNRLERGRLHYAYLESIFGPGVYATHSLQVVDGVGHDGRAMYLAAPGLAAVFGDGAQPSG
jgi:hypothetical protein